MDKAIQVRVNAIRRVLSRIELDHPANQQETLDMVSLAQAAIRDLEAIIDIYEGTI